MRVITQAAKQIPIAVTADVLVIGGGPAGIAAAVAASRTGADVLLVERYGSLGGMVSGGIVLQMDGLFDREKNRCIGGICWEIIERLRKIQGVVEDNPQLLQVDSELFKIVADEICEESGVVLRLHSWAVDTIMENGRVKGVILESKSGRQAVLGKVCIDATGDGDIAAFAGAEFDSHQMRIGLNYKIGGVNIKKFMRWEKRNPEVAKNLNTKIMELGSWPINLNATSHKRIYWVNVMGLARQGLEQISNKDSFDSELNAVNVEDLTYAETELRKSIMIAVNYYRENVPGFKNIQLLSIASQIGVRVSRCILGVHKLTNTEYETGVNFNDVVGITGIMSKDGNRLQVPYTALVPRKIDGLICAGRCISVDADLIHSIRAIAPCIMTGQAAGTAAALCIKMDVAPRNLDAETLRTQLAKDGAILPYYKGE